MKKGFVEFTLMFAGSRVASAHLHVPRDDKSDRVCLKIELQVIACVILRLYDLGVGCSEVHAQAGHSVGDHADADGFRACRGPVWCESLCWHFILYSMFSWIFCVSEAVYGRV